MNPSKKEELYQYIGNSTELVLRLEYLIDQWEKELLDSESSEEQYQSDWAYLQAHRNGKREMIRKLRKLTQHLY